MEWLDLLTGAVTSAASGGIVGLLGAGVSAVAKHFQLKAERAFQEKKWAHERELIAEQREWDKQQHLQEVEIVAQAGSWDNLGKSMEHDTALSKNSSEWVNNVKSLMRPVLTLVLNAMQFTIFWQLWTAYSLQQDNAVMTLINAPDSPATELLKYVIYSIMFAANTANLWWFAERGFAPPGMKNR